MDWQRNIGNGTSNLFFYSVEWRMSIVLCHLEVFGSDQNIRQRWTSVRIHSNDDNKFLFRLMCPINEKALDILCSSIDDECRNREKIFHPHDEEIDEINWRRHPSSSDFINEQRLMWRNNRIHRRRRVTTPCSEIWIGSIRWSDWYFVSSIERRPRRFFSRALFQLLIWSSWRSLHWTLRLPLCSSFSRWFNLFKSIRLCHFDSSVSKDWKSFFNVFWTKISIWKIVKNDVTSLNKGSEHFYRHFNW